MEAFVSGATDVLVATTVIEVGIDVPNATVMIIEGAERYGVSQLHQLRGSGRAGRARSHCLLFPEDAGGMARRRLKAVERERDGFKLAEVDLTLRGEGEVLGTRQSGLPRFAVAELPEETPTPGRAPATRCWPCFATTARSTLPELGPLLDAAHRRFGAGASRPDPALNVGMRVIAGELKGQRLVAPRGWKVRPTSDRVREAIFSALGEVGGARVLDLYCGTGALAIEALSRGAASGRPGRPRHAAGAGQRRAARPRRARRAGPRRCRPLARRALGESRDAPRFDLVFVDAPYKLADRVGQELNTHLPRLLADGGRAVVESGARRPLRLDSLERAAPAPLRRRRRLLLRGGAS